MTVRYAYIQNGGTIWGPGPNPYFITLQNGNIWEISAHTTAESEAVGIFVVAQINKRDYDERFERALVPVYSIVGGKPQETWSYEFVPEARERLIIAVDEHAEQLRTTIATEFPGQYAEYNEVYREAVEVAGLPLNATIAPGAYPFLEGDIGVTFSPLLNRLIANVREAANLVIVTRNMWQQAGADIRRQRLAIKNEVRDAATDAEAYAIYLDYITP